MTSQPSEALSQAIRSYVERVVAAAPPLSAKQADQLSSIFRYRPDPCKPH